MRSLGCEKNGIAELTGAVSRTVVNASTKQCITQNRSSQNRTPGTETSQRQPQRPMNDATQYHCSCNDPKHTCASKVGTTFLTRDSQMLQPLSRWYVAICVQKIPRLRWNSASGRVPAEIASRSSASVCLLETVAVRKLHFVKKLELSSI